MNLQERFRDVQRRVESAARRSGRNPSEVRLIPVSKFHPIEAIQSVMEFGIREFGESRVQELLEKQPMMDEFVQWHLIGHLQRNKVKYVTRMPNLALIHSVDSVRLAEEIHKRCEIDDRQQMNILLQVNVADDEDKFGIPVSNVLETVQEIARFDRIKIQGLMTIVPEVEEPEEVRGFFRRLRELAEEIATHNIPGIEMRELSMGMTNDFEVAVEEGATLVRVGSAIFGQREY